jgi:hypothetical protein
MCERAKSDYFKYVGTCVKYKRQSASEQANERETMAVWRTASEAIMSAVLPAAIVFSVEFMASLTIWKRAEKKKYVPDSRPHAPRISNLCLRARVALNS